MFTSNTGKLPRGRRGRGFAVGGSSDSFFADSLEWVGFPPPSAGEYDVDEEWFDRVTNRAMDETLPLHSLDPFEDESDGSHPVASGGLLGADPLPAPTTRDFPPQMAAARGVDKCILTRTPLPKESCAIDEPSAEILYEESAKEVFIWSIRFGTSKTQIREVFSGCGEVVSVKLPLDASGRKIRGIGFVAFAEESSVLVAVATLNDYELNGGRIRVRRNRGKMPIGGTQALQRERVDKHTSVDSLTVLVWNLPFALSAAALWALVQDSGAQVVDCRIVENSEGKSRGFGHVDLADANSVRIAMERVCGMVVGGRVVRVDYYSKPKRTHSGEFGQSRKESSALSLVHSMDVRSLSDPLPTAAPRYYQSPTAHSSACYRHSDDAFGAVYSNECETRRGYDCGPEIHRSAYQIAAAPLSATTVRPLQGAVATKCSLVWTPEVGYVYAL